MACTYLTDLTFGLTFMYATRHLQTDVDGFFLFRSFLCGIAGFLDIYLLVCLFRKKSSFLRIPLLLGLVVVQAALILLNIVRPIVNGEFWSDHSYVFLSFRVLLFLSLLRRYFFLSKVRSLIYEETEGFV
ncbi:MAG: hypothetical protein LBJ11_06890 [Oscillospiraceae bacterium]|jgi:hypothetical protein|nr:hypothetical protein [Oscillospiraceae bacterium]